MIMTMLTRFNPFKSLSRIDPTLDFEDFFRGFGMRPTWSNFETLPDFRLDVSEDDKVYRVKADIPGVDRKDIDVSIDGNQIAISAEIKRQKEDKQGEKTLRTERYYGKVYRAFALAQDVDQEQAQARYENGVLELTLPKRAAASSRRVTVQ
jgi:HSP20 family protein